MKKEALKLADLMIDVTDCETSEFYRAGQMIRKLVEELDKQTKPLSNDEIAQVHKETFSKLATDLDFARAIEERHGIK